MQRSCGCIIGQDYPTPIVDHAIVSKENMNRMKVAYADQRESSSNPPGKSLDLMNDADDEEQVGQSSNKRQKTK